jgi:nucleoside-diphosphate-sugar epimerase
MFTPAVCAAEANAARFVSGNHGHGVVLRFGGFMSAESEFTRTLIEHARRGTLYDPGPRHGYFPWVVVDDAAVAVVQALEIPSGTYNVVDDAQMTRDEKAEVLARAVGRDRPLRRLPTIVTRLAGDAGASARRSMRVSNARLRDLGWTPVPRQPVDLWSSLASATAVAAAA